MNLNRFKEIWTLQNTFTSLQREPKLFPRFQNIEIVPNIEVYYKCIS